MQKHCQISFFSIHFPFPTASSTIVSSPIAICKVHMAEIEGIWRTILMIFREQALCYDWHISLRTIEGGTCL